MEAPECGVWRGFSRTRYKEGPSKDFQTLFSMSSSGDYDSMRNYYTRFPNRWARIRDYIREPAAEMIGTMILMLFGCGVNCQVNLGGNTKVVASPKGDWLSVNFGWAIGAAMGGWVAGGISGGHVNPVVTICSAIFRRLSWKKVPLYILGQMLGAFLGSLFVYSNYFHAINLVEGGSGVRTVPGTAGLFATYAAPYVPAANCFFNEFLGTFLLLIVVFAITDSRNGAPLQAWFRWQYSSFYWA
ncbi:aquaporin-like protein [Multifurca ochricompacta]|uniref:Aquaporin-like protein n=1 Tax=Multifurca ochricompacta TaxID=376703 RepID=A0AAD4QLT7_9AGAM|nr:aquaporin-like protein [Multifurca ochricompacta]